MFGVDLNDQHRSYNSFGRAGTKWWRYLFNYLVQIFIINAFILTKSAPPHATESLEKDQLQSLVNDELADVKKKVIRLKKNSFCRAWAPAEV
ncbi:PiggyBac transposable element-derived protein [Plakobranchus ocellatus]|uniref:PiggyBac transposable element-derived protein n=1 Tax=Plakobranchus ocellatus TaxID=259542 RepID=A0AAV4AZ39_9GAST|nr:PiggyBac transposable element-derived protein [Plakobranchus ocellatus]